MFEAGKLCQNTKAPAFFPVSYFGKTSRHCKTQDPAKNHGTKEAWTDIDSKKVKQSIKN